MEDKTVERFQESVTVERFQGNVSAEQLMEGKIVEPFQESASAEWWRAQMCVEMFLIKILIATLCTEPDVKLCLDIMFAETYLIKKKFVAMLPVTTQKTTPVLKRAREKWQKLKHSKVK